MFQLVLFSLLITKPLIQSKCHRSQSVIDVLIRMFSNSFCWSEFKLSQNFFRRINCTADAQRIWPRTARAYAFPLNIWLTVTGVYTVLSAVPNPLLPITFPIEPKRLISCWNTPRQTKILIFIEDTISNAFMQSCWSNMTHDISTFRILHCSVTNNSNK